MDTQAKPTTPQATAELAAKFWNNGYY